MDDEVKKALDGIEEFRDGSRLKAQRSLDRKAAMARLYSQVLDGRLDEMSRRSWDSLTGDQRQDFMTSGGKKLPPDFHFHHNNSLSHHKETVDGFVQDGVIVEKKEHIFGLHGGDTSNPVSGRELKDPDWNAGYQVADATSAEGRRSLGMTGDRPQTSSSAASQVVKTSSDPNAAASKLDAMNEDGISGE